MSKTIKVTEATNLGGDRWEIHTQWNSPFGSALDAIFRATVKIGWDENGHYRAIVPSDTIEFPAEIEEVSKWIFWRKWWIAKEIQSYFTEVRIVTVDTPPQPKFAPRKKRNLSPMLGISVNKLKYADYDDEEDEEIWTAEVRSPVGIFQCTAHLSNSPDDHMIFLEEIEYSPDKPNWMWRFLIWVKLDFLIEEKLGYVVEEQ